MSRSTHFLASGWKGSHSCSFSRGPIGLASRSLSTPCRSPGAWTWGPGAHHHSTVIAHLRDGRSDSPFRRSARGPAFGSDRSAPRSPPNAFAPCLMDARRRQRSTHTYRCAAVPTHCLVLREGVPPAPVQPHHGSGRPLCSVMVQAAHQDQQPSLSCRCSLTSPPSLPLHDSLPCLFVRSVERHVRAAFSRQPHHLERQEGDLVWSLVCGSALAHRYGGNTRSKRCRERRHAIRICQLAVARSLHPLRCWKEGGLKELVQV